MTNGKHEKKTKKKKAKNSPVTTTVGTISGSPAVRQPGLDRREKAEALTQSVSDGEEERKNELSEDELRALRREEKGKEREEQGEIRDSDEENEQLKQDTAEAIQQSFMSLAMPSSPAQSSSSSSSSTSTKPVETKESFDRARKELLSRERYQSALDATHKEGKRALVALAREIDRLARDGKYDEARRKLDELNRLIAHVLKLAQRAPLENGPFDDMKFGTEFTFTTGAIAGSTNEDPNNGSGVVANKLVERWRQVMASKNVKIERLDVKGSPAYRFTYPDGFWYVISRDDACLETQALPITYPQASKDYRKHIDDIFETATALGLTPHADIGGGHLSLDLATTFGQNAKAFRNFLVNYTNEDAKWTQLDDDLVNAPTIPELPRDLRIAFRNIIAEFDRRYDSDTEADMTIQELADRIEREVYRYARQSNQVGGGLERHYQAINLEHIRDAGPAQRIEMRRIRAQQDASAFLQQMLALMDLRDRSRDAEELVALILSLALVEADKIPSGSVKVKK